MYRCSQSPGLDPPAGNRQLPAPKRIHFRPEWLQLPSLTGPSLRLVFSPAVPAFGTIQPGFVSNRIAERGSGKSPRCAVPPRPYKRNVMDFGTPNFEATAATGAGGSAVTRRSEPRSALYSAARPLCASAAINPASKCFWRYRSAAGMSATDVNY